MQLLSVRLKSMYAELFNSRFPTINKSSLVHGVDISGWQTDYVPVAEDKFAWVKCSEGLNFTEVARFAQTERLLQNGSLVDGYHFSHGNPAKDEANWFIKSVSHGTLEFNFSPALDMEGSLVPFEGWDAWAIEWCERVEQALQRPVIIYTARWWTAGRLFRDVGGRKLWVANYAPAGSTAPLLPGGWSDWAAWQWTDRPVPGGPGLDRNVAKADWLATFSRPSLELNKPIPAPRAFGGISKELQERTMLSCIRTDGKTVWCVDTNTRKYIALVELLPGFTEWQPIMDTLQAWSLAGLLIQGTAPFFTDVPVAALNGLRQACGNSPEARRIDFNSRY